MKVVKWFLVISIVSIVSIGMNYSNSAQAQESGCSGNACKHLATSASGFSDGSAANGNVLNSHASKTIIIKWDYGSAFGKGGSVRGEILPGSSKGMVSPATTGFMKTYTANFK